MRWIAALFLASFATLHAQPLTVGDPAFVGVYPSSTRWWPTNAPGMFVWLETVPFLTMSNNTDNSQVFRWTNIIGNTTFASDQTLQPTNFISGGGNNGSEDHIHWQEASGGTQRLVGNPGNPTSWTFMIVCNCDDATTSPGGLVYNGSQMVLQFHNGTLQLTEDGSTLLTGNSTITTSWYIITAVFNGASSEIDTNGVLYVSGNAGSGTLNSMYLGQFQAYKGNISRVWGWTNTLSAGNLSSAIAQCKKDYGF